MEKKIFLILFPTVWTHDVGKRVHPIAPTEIFLNNILDGWMDNEGLKLTTKIDTS